MKFYYYDKALCSNCISYTKRWSRMFSYP